MSKRGAIEVQFNWIFVLIAGAVILAFFVSVVMKQKALADDKASVIILNKLETILTGAKESTGTVNIIEIPNRNVEFECGLYRVGNAHVNIEDKILFSPDLIKGKKLILWALDWSIPFKITNFLYVTHPEVRYIVVGTDPLANQIYTDWLPDDPSFNKEITNDVSSISDLNNYRVKLIFVNGDSVAVPGLQSVPNSRVTAIKIFGNSEKGTISFFQKNSAGWGNDIPFTLPYLKKESIIGAIFAQDAERYQCAMDNAMTKAGIISTSYDQRSLALAGTYGSGRCSAPHLTASSPLPYPSTFTDTNINSIYNAEQILKSTNGRAKLDSCALIY